MSLKKLAIVTGGTRGIGKEVSLQLFDSAFEVVAVYRDDDKAAKRFHDETGIRTVKVDVTDLSSCVGMVDSLHKEHGACAVLVNNAGITRDGMLHKMEEGDWHDVIAANLTSCYNMCRAVIPMMRDMSYGRVINISSINGQKGQLGQANYSAAKAGMIGFTKALALESARKNITVNAVCPGYVATDMTETMDSAVLESVIRQIPVGRMGRPHEIADIVTFLASDKAGFITGSTLSANGGQYMA